MPLPPAMARRRVVATNITDDGTIEGDPINGLVTYEAEVRELIVSGVSVFVGELARPIRAPVTNGALSVDLIAGDDPDVDSGLDRPFAYKVTRSWDTKHPFHIVVPMGPTGVAANDPPVNESTLHVPNPPGGVAIVKGPKGDPGSGGGSSLTETPAGSGLYVMG